LGREKGIDEEGREKGAPGEKRIWPFGKPTQRGLWGRGGSKGNLGKFRRREKKQLCIPGWGRGGEKASEYVRWR